MPAFISSEEKYVPILMYHSISEHATPKFKQFVVSLRLFSEQIAYLYHHKYTPITISQFIAARSHKDAILPEKSIIITFDDGFEDFYINALPVLLQYNFTATLYIATSFVGSTSSWLEREGEGKRPMLTWKQLSEISAQGVECGAHSHTHPQLDVMPPIRAKEEIERSKKILEDYLGREIISFAYPYGYQTKRLQQLVYEAGYLSACAVKHSVSSKHDNPFALARLMVDASTQAKDFMTLVTGQNSSPISAILNVYARTRTPIWQVVRRSSALVQHSFYRR